MVNVFELLWLAVMMDWAQSKEGLKLDSGTSDHCVIVRYHYNHQQNSK
jgi:hypothetical protein